MSSDVLKGTVICLAGVIKQKDGVTVRQNDMRARIANAGGQWTSTVNGRCTHLVATPSEFDNRSRKVQEAEKFPGLKIVHPDWMLVSMERQQLEDADQYLLSKTTTTTTNANGKRPRSPISNDGNHGAAAAKAQKKSDPAKPRKDGQATTNTKKPIPAYSDALRAADYHVYVSEDGTIYDATLNLSYAGLNANKFYVIQALQRDAPSDFLVLQQWGRVGEKGQGMEFKCDDDSEKAINKFKQIFRSKSGLKWENRSDTPVSGKYAFVERNYEDSDDEEEEEDQRGEEKKKKKKEKGEEKQGQSRQAIKSPESQLHPHVQALMRLIFNHSYFKDTMASFSYDANKLPLGKLSNRTLSRGFELLKQLADIIANQVNVQQKAIQCADLSNQYFTLIPHALGRRTPPVIVYADQVKKETELLSNLSEMEIANEIMKIAGKAGNQGVNFLDSQYQGLNLDEMTSLDPASAEFVELKGYLEGSSGPSHGIHYEPQHIFRVSRAGEEERYNTSPYAGRPDSHRLLLWHGSRATNYGGILSQGLRIAPPEAPSTGYMFGKGIYFADCSSKSANYCKAVFSGHVGALLLCEVDVGPMPMYELRDADGGAAEKAAAAGKTTTLGLGRMVPGKWKDAGCVSDTLRGAWMPDCKRDNGGGIVNKAEEADGRGLAYNEYIAYDVRQVRVRYLVLTKIRGC